jgi:N-acetylglucosaminyldiphosphoundecaprenol N-acetyl-beta-D-mannosaminyltransferase
MPKPIQILNTKIHNLSMQETIDLVDKSIQNGEHIHHSVVNAGKIVLMQDDVQLRESVNNADIINADGQAVIWASKILNQPIKERVAGIDLMKNLVKLAHDKGYKIYCLSAKEDILSKVVQDYKRNYSEELIAGYRNGYFSKEEEQGIAQDIANSGANMLFVAISSPKKENFLYEHREVLKKVNFIMGVGGSFDVISGKTKRAPKWMQKSGLEWLYRVIQEPKRMWKRYLVGNTKFLLLVFREKFKK